MSTTTYAQNYEASEDSTFRKNLAAAMVQYARTVQSENPSSLTVPEGYNKGLYEVNKKQNLHEERVKLAYSVLGNSISYSTLYSPSAAEYMDIYLSSEIIYMASDDEAAENTDYYTAVTDLWTSWSIQIKENIDLPGWNYTDIIQSKYYRPKDVLFYYGYPNSFNSGSNGWDNEKVAQDMAKYELIILGDGVQDSEHADYSNTEIIIPRIKALNSQSLIFGYVSVDQTLSNFQDKVDGWNTLGVHGIFMDESGYDFGRTRAEFNTRVDYIHGKTNANICFANAWNTDHIIGTDNDTSYPNSTYNSSEVESNLSSSDWILLESFPINTTSYTSSTPDGYESASDWETRGDKAVSLREIYGINFVGVGIINNDNANGQDLFDFGFTSSLMYSLEAFGTSDTSYASSSAEVTFWTRPDTTKLGQLYEIKPNIEQDNNDSDIYIRYAQYGKLKLDFSTSAQSATITKY